jgi:hypothetical protein
MIRLPSTFEALGVSVGDRSRRVPARPAGARAVGIPTAKSPSPATDSAAESLDEGRHVLMTNGETQSNPCKQHRKRRQVRSPRRAAKAARHNVRCRARRVVLRVRGGGGPTQA